MNRPLQKGKYTESLGDKLRAAFFRQGDSLLQAGDFNTSNAYQTYLRLRQMREQIYVRGYQYHRHSGQENRLYRALLTPHQADIFDQARTNFDTDNYSDTPISV